MSDRDYDNSQPKPHLKAKKVIRIIFWAWAVYTMIYIAIRLITWACDRFR